jgi:hypothetical protein
MKYALLVIMLISTAWGSAGVSIAKVIDISNINNDTISSLNDDIMSAYQSFGKEHDLPINFLNDEEMDVQNKKNMLINYLKFGNDYCLDILKLSDQSELIIYPYVFIDKKGVVDRIFIWSAWAVDIIFLHSGSFLSITTKDKHEIGLIVASKNNNFVKKIIIADLENETINQAVENSIKLAMSEPEKKDIQYDVLLLAVSLGLNMYDKYLTEITLGFGLKDKLILSGAHSKKDNQMIGIGLLLRDMWKNIDIKYRYFLNLGDDFNRIAIDIGYKYNSNLSFSIGSNYAFKNKKNDLFLSLSVNYTHVLIKKSRFFCDQKNTYNLN